VRAEPWASRQRPARGPGPAILPRILQRPGSTLIVHGSGQCILAIKYPYEVEPRVRLEGVDRAWRAIELLLEMLNVSCSAVQHATIVRSRAVPELPQSSNASGRNRHDFIA
jgi:hypothetical protein